jgi:hypothetical protein
MIPCTRTLPLDDEKWVAVISDAVWVARVKRRRRKMERRERGTGVDIFRDCWGGVLFLE